MKKIICLLLTAFIFIMSGCHSTSAPGSTDRSKPIANVLADKGLELIGKVDKFAECEEYISLYTADDEIAKQIKDIAENDYTNPQAIYMIENFDTILFENMMSEIKLPEDIAKMVKDRFAAALPTQITARNGATALAAGSILSYGESFILESLQSSVTYLYTYGNGYNFMVNYNPNDENIVNATVTMVVDDELSKCTSKEEVIHFLKDALNLEDLSVSLIYIIEEK